MNLKKLDNKGYTALELLVVIVIFSVLGILFSYLLRQNAADARDVQRKRDISAIYFALEANKKDGQYPEVITQDNLVGIDPEALVDTNGIMLGNSGAEYRYYPADCSNALCKSYELKVTLEKEAEFIKKSAS
ncbi:MAG: type II secretion system protein [Candidatus Nomurabacteria bacterium]|nr:MAG: type II secretion system protein [Candidatus Nomurabacteria bacterium]